MKKIQTVFENEANFSERFISDYKQLSGLVVKWKKQGLKIVLTSGSFDLLHIGHAQYLSEAKKCGDVLVVGVDNDEKVRKRKGPYRPVVSEDERFKMLMHLRSVDIVVPKGLRQSSLYLLRTMRPDILVISETTNHSSKKLKMMEGLCGEIILLPPQATTSTSAKVRLLFTQGAQQFAEKITQAINDLLHGMAV